ncbi:hypothetical protein LTR27_003165 [Elasticomyces elasticus]|nr:hypothetical protein LTR27_003165 [Elasticomyces elasticus]
MNYDPEIDDWLEWNQERMEHEERILSGRLDDSLSSPITPGNDINPSATCLRSSASYEQLRAERSRRARHGLTAPSLPPSGLHFPDPDSESSSSHSQHDDTTTQLEVSATASAPELRALSLSPEARETQQEPPHPDAVAVITVAAASDSLPNEPDTVGSLSYSRFYDCAAPLLVEQPDHPHFRTDAQQRAIPLTVRIEGHPIARAHVVDSGTPTRPGQLSIRFVGSVFDDTPGRNTIPRAYVVLRHVANDKESGTTISGVYVSRSRAMKAAMGLFDQRVSSQGFAIPLHTGYRWQPGVLGYGYELTAWKDEDEGSVEHEEAARSRSAEQGQADGGFHEDQGAEQDRYANEPEHARDAERAQNPAEGGEEEFGGSAEQTQRSDSQWTAHEKLSMLMMS